MRNSAFLIRGAAPETPRFIAVAPESFPFGAAFTAPAIPASESTLGSHLCVALSSAQVPSEWKIPTQPCNDFSLNGNYSLSCCLTPGVHFISRALLFTHRYGDEWTCPGAAILLRREHVDSCRYELRGHLSRVLQLANSFGLAAYRTAWRAANAEPMLA